MIGPEQLTAVIGSEDELYATLAAGTPIPGPPGPEGPQGEQGEQGEQGIQGVQGIQGIQGIQGEQGIQGQQGDPGSSADVYDYQFSSNTTPPPGDGQVRFNSADQTTATAIYFDDNQATGEDVGNFLLRLVPANTRVYLQDKDDGSRWQYYETTGEPIDGGAYVEYPVVWLEGGVPLAAQRLMVAFMIEGAVGPSGPQGIQGEQGPQGIQGIQGPAGNPASQTPWAQDVDAASHDLNNGRWINGTYLTAKAGSGIYLMETSYAVDEKYWRFRADTKVLIGQCENDALAATPWLQVHRTGSTPTKVVLPSGNVGIGTADPQYKLDVIGEARITAPVKFGSSGTEIAGGSADTWFTHIGTGDLHLNATSARNIRFYTNGLQRLHIGSSGNVGIGVDPAYKLDVAGEARLNDSLRVTNVANAVNGQWACTDQMYIGTTSNHAVYLTQNNTPHTTFAPGGNVGIGVYPGYKLDVAGDVNTTGNYRKNGTVVMLTAEDIIERLENDADLRERLKKLLL